MNMKNRMKQIISAFLLIFYCVGALDFNVVFAQTDIGFAFDKEYLDFGENSYHIFGTNRGKDILKFTVIAAVYENDILKKTSYGKTKRVLPGEKFDFEESINVDDIDLLSSCLKVFIWDNVNNMKPKTEVLKPQGLKFTYSIEQDCVTSAGVYDENRLIRTLWSGKKTVAGEHEGIWDGKDDNGYLMDSKEYTVKVMSNNVSYNFDTIIGNNTEWESEDTKFYGMSFFGDMVCVDDKMYYTQPYQEGNKTGAFFRTSNPHISCNVERFGDSRQTNRRVATDGNILYYGNTEPGGKYSFVYAYDEKTHEPITFEYGRTVANFWGHTDAYPSAINYVEHEPCSNIGGLDAQNNGDFLFVSYIYTGKVYVLNKITGQNLTEIELERPQALCCDYGNGIYVGYKNSEGTMSVNYYTVDDDGTLSYIDCLNENFDDIRDMTVSPDGKTLVVADGGNQNQIKAFNIKTSQRSWTFGSGESYYTDPTVKEDKLLLNNKDLIANNTFVTFEEDNNILWLGDLGNCRAIKLDLSRGVPVVMDTIMFQNGSHNAAVDLNNPTRVFENLREFEIDYSEPDSKKAWRLKRNWQKAAENINYYDQGLMENTVTLSNGRTYCKIYDADAETKYLYELCNASFRNTGIDLISWDLRKDGSLGRNYHYGTNRIWVIKDFEGFDENNNPIWGEEKEIARIPVDNFSPTKSASRTSNVPITDSGVLAVMTPWIRDDYHKESKVMHLGGVNLINNTTTWEWKTSPQGSKNYRGDFPKDGIFEAGNYVSGTASDVKTIDNHIIYQYYGEFYKSGQTDMFYHYYDNGLLVGVFGKAAKQQINYGEKLNTGDLAGNGFDFFFVRPEGMSDDEMYIYQNDESHKGGIWRWKVTGLKSINEQTIKIRYDNGIRKGLLWEYLPQEEYDSVMVTEKGVCESLNTGADIKTDNDFLLKYTGYFKVPENISGLRCTIRKGQLRIVLNKSEIVNVANDIYTADLKKTELETGKLYPIEIECRKYEGEFITPTIMAIYGTNSRGFNIDEQIFRDNEKYSDSTYMAYNLLDGLPFDSELPEEICGWISSPGVHESSGNRTNVVNDGYDETRDLSVKTYLYDNNSEYDQFRETFRALPDAKEGLKKWTLNAEIAALSGWLNTGILGDESKSLGMHFDVVDENGKIISRFFWGRGDTFGEDNPDNNWSYANGEKLYQGDIRGGGIYIVTNYYHEFSTPSPLTISGSNAGITFSYYGKTKTLPVFEEDADWLKPAKIRISQFTGGLCGQPLLFEMNLSKLEYIMEYEDADSEKEYNIDNLKTEADTFGINGVYDDYRWNIGNKYGDLGWTSEKTQDIILPVGINEVATSPDDMINSPRNHCVPADALEWNGFLFVLCNDKGRLIKDVNGNIVYSDKLQFLDDDAILASKQNDGTYYLADINGEYITDSSGNAQIAENFSPVNSLPSRNYSWLEIYDISDGKKEHVADWDLSKDMNIDGEVTGMNYMAVGLDVTDDYIYCYLDLCGLDGYWFDSGRNGGLAVFKNNVNRNSAVPYPVPERAEPDEVIDSLEKCNIFSRNGNNIQPHSQELGFRHFIVNDNLITMNTSYVSLPDINSYVGITDLVNVQGKKLTTVNECIAEYLGIGRKSENLIVFNTDKYPMAEKWKCPQIVDFQVDGAYAYAVINYAMTENEKDNYYSMFLKYDITDPYAPVEIARYIYKNTQEITNMALKTDKGYLYAAQRFGRHFAGSDMTNLADPHFLIFDVSEADRINLVNDIKLSDFDDKKTKEADGVSYRYGITSLTVIDDCLYAVALCGRGQNSALSMIFKLNSDKSSVLECKAIRNQILFQPKMGTVKFDGRIFLPTEYVVSSGMILMPRVTVLDMQK